jgi:hypothetical protein
MPANASAPRAGVAETRRDLGVNVEMDELEERAVGQRGHLLRQVKQRRR